MNINYTYAYNSTFNNSVLITGLTWFLIGFSGCNNFVNETSIPILDLKAIVGKDTTALVKVLGKPDYTFYGYGEVVKLAYGARNLEITLKEGKADQLLIRKVSSHPFDKHVLEDLGLKVKEPTFVVPQQWMQWENLDGIAVITVFKDNRQGVEQIEIKVTE